MLTRTGPHERPFGCPDGALEQHRALSERNDAPQTQTWFHDRAGEWAVLKYQVAADGSVRDVRVVKDSGPRAESARLVQIVSAWEPVPAPPGALQVSELFWCPSQACLTAGSLESQLSELDDGRWIRL